VEKICQAFCSESLIDRSHTTIGLHGPPGARPLDFKEAAAAMGAEIHSAQKQQQQPLEWICTTLEAAATASRVETHSMRKQQQQGIVISPRSSNRRASCDYQTDKIFLNTPIYYTILFSVCPAICSLKIGEHLCRQSGKISV
jgi:hypothetical protein